MELSYSYVSAESEHVARVIAAYEIESDNDVVLGGVMLKFDMRTGKWGSFKLPWEACGLATRTVPVPEVFVLNSEGFVGRGYGTFNVDDLAKAPGSVPNLGPMREVRAVGDAVVAVGMQRHVLACRAGSTWQVLHTPSLLAANPGNGVFGLNSIHGLSMDELWAVGFGGEIWCLRTGTWHRVDSPTNLALLKVLVLRDGRAIAGGQSGLALRYDGANWREALTLEDGSEIWDACYFKGAVYLATEQCLYRLDASLTAAEPVVVGDGLSCGYLSTDGNVLWSAGSEDIAYTRDGVMWTVVTP